MDPSPDPRQLEAEIEALREKNRQLEEELQDLQILYENTIEHGEAVEDQLAEKNIELERTQERLNKELAEATNYIRSILPPPRLEAPETGWMLVPSTELGGDSFGYHWIDDDHFAVYLLDVCGHGVGAALLSVAAINVLRSAALPNTNFREPGAVLTSLNQAFQMETQNNMYFTIWYGVYQPSSRTLRHSSAGHPPALLLRKAKALQLLCPGLVLGGMPGSQYQTQADTVEPGDRLLLLSDGAYEIRKPEGGMLAFGEFVSFVAGLPADGSELERILAWVHSLNGPGPLEDDFSLLKVVF